MLHVLDPKSNKILVFPKGSRIKPPNLCFCPLCDVECDKCSSEAECPHRGDGTIGGLCVSHEEQSLKWFQNAVSFTDCRCVDDECEHLERLKEEQKKHTPGSRPKGTQRKKKEKENGLSKSE